jgi:hypothetical protein
MIALGDPETIFIDSGSGSIFIESDPYPVFLSPKSEKFTVKKSNFYFRKDFREMPPAPCGDPTIL